MTMEIKIQFNEAMIEKLKQIPIMLRLAPAERILKAMAKPVVARAKAIAPSSVESGTRKEWSAKTAAKFAANEGRKNIGYVYRKGQNGGYLMVGGKAPKANSFNFEASDKGRKVFYWGKDMGRVKRIDPSLRFMTRAYLDTRDAQASAGKQQLEKELKELKIG